MEIPPPAAAVICAAGSSSRMKGIKKEYQKIYISGIQQTVLEACVAAFVSVRLVEIIVIAIPQNTEENARSALSEYFFSSLKPKIYFVDGGKTRRASVYNALSFLVQFNPGIVLIHDGARPWISPSLISDIIKATEKYGAAIPALALSDTPKEFSEPLHNRQQNDEKDEKTVFIKTHLKRANTGIAQTPQGFKFPEILLAHKKTAEIENEEFTDDAEIWGRFCGEVAVIPGSQENRKITFPHDIDSTVYIPQFLNNFHKKTAVLS
jgi:2-C-methyl-D-erythritol 4-phosphate cytidylyltransferase/2-C-methyl-D-erythritol 4-phosphate cytidylyltransferase/2-C-methyl-D-erythritol 2,4-cyclodiphosphate synthase